VAKHKKDSETTPAVETGVGTSGAPEPRKAAQWEKPAHTGQRFEIRTPNAGFNGNRSCVKFQEGVGYTDDEGAAAHCRDLGYQVIDAEDEASKAK
jgi:hypothetical protein